MFLHILPAPAPEQEEEEVDAEVPEVVPNSEALTGVCGATGSPRPSIDIHMLSKDPELAHLEA